MRQELDKPIFDNPFSTTDLTKRFYKLESMLENGQPDPRVMAYLRDLQIVNGNVVNERELELNTLEMIKQEYVIINNILADRGRFS